MPPEPPVAVANASALPVPEMHVACAIALPPFPPTEPTPLEVPPAPPVAVAIAAALFEEVAAPAALAFAAPPSAPDPLVLVNEIPPTPPVALL